MYQYTNKYVYNNIVYCICIQEVQWLIGCLIVITLVL
jgi:hypothetical protein